MVESKEIIDEFDDLGFTLENPQVIQKLCTFCDLYGINQKKISREYLRFAMEKKEYNEPSCGQQTISDTSNDLYLLQS